MKNFELSLRIREIRKAKGMTQEDLAESSRVSLRTIQRIENGETETRGDTLRRLAQALNTSPDELLDWRKIEDRGFLTFMKLSGLSFLIQPILGVIITMALWILKKDKIKNIDSEGKKLFNFLVTNACIYYLSFILVFVVLRQYNANVPKYDLPFFYMVLTIGIYYLNITTQILLNSYKVYKGRPSKYWLTLKILK